MILWWPTDENNYLRQQILQWWLLLYCWMSPEWPSASHPREIHSADQSTHQDTCRWITLINFPLSSTEISTSNHHSFSHYYQGVRGFKTRPWSLGPNAFPDFIQQLKGFKLPQFSMSLSRLHNLTLLRMDPTSTSQNGNPTSTAVTLAPSMNSLAGGL